MTPEDTGGEDGRFTTMVECAGCPGISYGLEIWREHTIKTGHKAKRSHRVDWRVHL